MEDLLQELRESDVVSTMTMNKIGLCLTDLFQEDNNSYFEACVLIIDKLVNIRLLNDDKLDNFCTAFLLQPDFRIIMKLIQAFRLEKEECFRREKLFNLLIKFMKNQKRLSLVFSSITCSNHNNYIIDNFTTMLIQLPTITANIFELLNDKFFQSTSYFNHVSIAFYKFLIITSEKVKQGLDQYFYFACLFTEKLCLERQEDIFWNNCIRRILKDCDQNYVIRRITQRIFVNHSTHAYESLFIRILEEANTQQIIWLFGEDLLKNSKIEFYFIKKFLVIFNPPKPRPFADHLINLLSEYPNHFEQALHNVLDVWGNASLVKHQSNEQHHFICILMALMLRNLKQKDALKIVLQSLLENEKFKLTLLHALEAYLSRVELAKRSSGLFIGQSWINVFNFNRESIDFEQKDDEFSLELKAIINETSNKNDTKEAIVEQEEKSEIQEEEEEECPFIPLDMSNDLSLEDRKKPLYLRDCLDGLTDNENIDWKNACVSECEELIKRNRHQSKELSEQLCQSLLYMEEIDTQQANTRKQCLITLTSINPKQCAKYLVSQFYAQDLVIEKKLEVLSVLSGAAKELSKLQIKDEGCHSIQQIIKPNDQESLKNEWQQVVDQRIKSNTRILSGAKVATLSSVNRFAPVAQDFFLPLLQQFHTGVSLRMEEEDYMVLGRLFLTLGDLLRCASQQIVTKTMFLELVDFITNFKFHQESFVRASIAKCINDILFSVPPYFLFDEHIDKTLELQKVLLHFKVVDPKTFHDYSEITFYMLEKNINNQLLKQIRA